MPKRIQLSDRDAAQMLEVTPTAESAISSGRPLSQAERSFFDPRFGTDFSGVRVHSDVHAGELAQTLQAKAFTMGRDIYFASGRYAPGTSEGRKLLGHELTHVVQQAGESNNMFEADVEMSHRTTTPSIQLQVEECEARKHKWKIGECTSKITGVADPASVIVKARKAAENCVSKAISILRAPSEQTRLQVDRHFHCPSISEIMKIRKAFEQIQNHLPSVEVLCYTSPPCKKDTSGCYVHPHLAIEVCPNFFSGDYEVNYRIRMFIAAAGWVPTQFSTYCGERESCYDDFTKSASEMANNPFSYSNCALEALGYAPVSEEVDVPCRPRHTDFNVNVPPDATKNPRAIRPLSAFESKSPGSRIVPVWQDATGKYFIYYSGLPGGRVYMPGEGERYYLPEGLI